MNQKTFLDFLAAGLILVAVHPFPAAAQSMGLVPASSTEGEVGDYQLSPSDETHPPVRLTPDKAEIVNLDRDAKSVIVGNPAHLGIQLSGARRLILIPAEPGATHFTVLDSAGRIVMQRHVIVASPQQKYIRIRRSCVNSTSGTCRETSVYYCPDMCHNISVKQPGEAVPLTGGSTSNIPYAPYTADNSDAGGGMNREPEGGVGTEPETPSAETPESTNSEAPAPQQ